MAKNQLLTDEGRFCVRCGKFKSWDKFCASKKGGHGHDPRCRQCRSELYKEDYAKDPEKYRERGRRATNKYKEHKYLYTRNCYALSRYGISSDELVSIATSRAIEQDGRCAICGRVADVVGLVKERGKSRLVMDHNHQNGQMRGLLCDLCNTALGKFGDNKETLMSAVEYLEYWEVRH